MHEVHLKVCFMLSSFFQNHNNSGSMQKAYLKCTGSGGISVIYFEWQKLFWQSCLGLFRALFMQIYQVSVLILIYHVSVLGLILW